MEIIIQDLKHEIDELKSDVKRLEEKITAIEQSPRFKDDEIRYRRLVEEKQMLLQHLCQLRTDVYTKALLQNSSSSIPPTPNLAENVKAEYPAAKRQRTNKRGFSEVNSDGSDTAGDIEYYVDKNDDQHQGNPNTTTHSVPEEPSQPVINPVLVSQPAQPLVLPQPSPAQRGGALVPPPYQTNPQLPVIPPTVPPSTAGATIVPQSNSQSSNGSTNNLNNNQPIPALQVEEYLETKMKLAQIMRDFNEKKICFVGVDGGRIYVQQYQQISARVKNGEDISMFLRGRIVMFVTAVDKKKRSITETKLFIPDFELLQR